MAPVVASFIADVVSGPIPLTVVFTDTSTGVPTNWLWDFGDGSVSDVQHPVHEYTVVGIYTVSLRVFVSTGVILSNGTRSNPRRRIATGFSNVQAHANLLAESFDSTDIVGAYRVSVHPTSGLHTYTEGYSDLGLDLTLFTSHIIEFRLPFAFSNNPFSGLLFNETGIVFPGRLPQFTDFLVEDVTPFAGSSITRTFTDISGVAIIPDPGPARSAGWVLASNARIYRYTFSSAASHISVDYINAGVDWCGKGWIMVAKRVVDIGPGVHQLVVTTDKPAHLFAGYMAEAPSKDRVWSTKYGQPHRCQPLFNIMMEGDVEQNEAGDTIEHTFELSGFPLLDVLFIILLGDQCGVFSNSKSPLFSVDNS